MVAGADAPGISREEATRNFYLEAIMDTQVSSNGFRKARPSLSLKHRVGKINLTPLGEYDRLTD